MKCMRFILQVLLGFSFYKVTLVQKTSSFTRVCVRGGGGGGGSLQLNLYGDVRQHFKKTDPLTE